MPEPVDRIEQEPFPPFVITADDKRRWELATRAALTAYGFELGQGLDRMDRVLIIQAQRSLFRDRTLDTGQGVVSQEEREAMRAMGVL